MVRVIKFCIDNNTIVGAINATAPNPERNRDFSRILGGVLRRPASLPMPSWMIKLLFGQMGVELLLQGQQVIPKKLTQTGFEFIYQRLPPALENIVGSELANDKNS
jgi:NAD dependent epimerase/dehydratase family enzyme